MTLDSPLHARLQSDQSQPAIRQLTAYEMQLLANGSRHLTIFDGKIGQVHYQTQGGKDKIIVNVLINYVLIKINKFYFLTKYNFN